MHCFSPTFVLVFSYIFLILSDFFLRVCWTACHYKGDTLCTCGSASESIAHLLQFPHLAHICTLDDLIFEIFNALGKIPVCNIWLIIIFILLLKIEPFAYDQPVIVAQLFTPRYDNPLTAACQFIQNHFNYFQIENKYV